MKKTHYTEEQIAFCAETGRGRQSGGEKSARKMGISGNHILQLEEKVWRHGRDRAAPPRQRGRNQRLKRLVAPNALRRNFGLSSSHLSEINIRISAPLFL